MATSKLQVYARLARGFGAILIHRYVSDMCACILVKEVHGAFYACVRTCVRACTRVPSTLRNADWRMHAYTLRVRFPRCETCPRAPPSGSGKTVDSLSLSLSIYICIYISCPFLFFVLLWTITHAGIKETLNWIFSGPTQCACTFKHSWAQVALKFVLRMLRMCI